MSGLQYLPLSRTFLLSRSQQPAPYPRRTPIKTIHSALKIRVSRGGTGQVDGSELRSAASQELQSRMNGVDFILIDETSMVGLRLFGGCRPVTG